jgi:hypothetical protein
MEQHIFPIPISVGRYLFDVNGQYDPVSCSDLKDRIFSISEGQQIDIKTVHPVLGLVDYSFVGVTEEAITPTYLTEIAPSPIYSYSTALEARIYKYTYEGIPLSVTQVPPKSILYVLESKNIRSYPYGGYTICREQNYEIEGEIATAKEVLFITKSALYSYNLLCNKAFLYFSS